MDYNNFKLKKPEIEAVIYYLPTSDGGRSSAVFNGYRGQFYYDEHDWDGPQQFLDKIKCEPGELIRVAIEFFSPEAHIGKFFNGKEFLIREGNKVVGKGIITKVIREDYQK